MMNTYVTKILMERISSQPYIYISIYSSWISIWSKQAALIFFTLILYKYTTGISSWKWNYQEVAVWLLLIFFANVDLNPLTIFPNHIKFMIASAAGTTNIKRRPTMCICMTCHLFTDFLDPKMHIKSIKWKFGEHNFRCIKIFRVFFDFRKNELVFNLTISKLRYLRVPIWLIL